MNDFVKKRMLEKYAKKYVPEMLKEMNVELLAIKQTGRGVAVIYYLPEEQEIGIATIPCPLAEGWKEEDINEEFIRNWIKQHFDQVLTTIYVSKNGVVWIDGNHVCDNQLIEIANISFIVFLTYKLRKIVRKIKEVIV